MRSDLSVLVLSCDKYSHLLPYFTKLFDKYWECTDVFPKYITTETVQGDYKGFTSILTQESNWTNSLAKALNHISTPYVFIILDDIFLIRTMSCFHIERGLGITKALNLDKYIYHYPHEAFIGKLDPTPLAPNICKVHQDSEYTMTLQMSIWNVAFLKKCLKEGESPWQFEIEGTLRVNQTIQHLIYMEVVDRFHEEATARGSFTPHYYSILQKEGML